VKIRGFRVELGEVEAVLAGHPAVQKSVVIVREDSPGDRRLIAYVVLGDQELPLSELSSFLKEQLPDYMVPTALVLLDALPLTPNGKLDRQALPVPDKARSLLEKTFVAARNPVEEVLAGIWSEVLGVEQVGVNDNFFELGGHSLLATRLISRLRDTFQVEIPLRSLFEKPSVAGLAAAILDKPSERVKVEKAAQLLMRLAQLSEEETERMLEEKTTLFRGSRAR
jgi:acyl carrier protein